MTPQTARRLRSTFWITVVCVIYVIIFDILEWRYETGEINTLFSVAIGIALGVCLALLEESRFAEKMGHLPFTVALLTKTTTYILVVTAMIIFLSMMFGAVSINDESTSDFTVFDLFVQAEYYVFLGSTLILFVIIVFFRQLDRLLGHGVLVKVFLGRYRQPRQERRIFMFLDLKSSTRLAERLSPEAYYSFVNDFFRDISLPVLNSGGEVYQYIGDEVVITWRQTVGTRSANCLRVFFAIDEAIENRKQYYLDRYGVIPEYKAGAHFGKVITAEIGDLKKEIVYNGDVLNTTARIQAMCNELDRRFVVSQRLLDVLMVPENIPIEKLGPIALRGKEEPVELVGLA